MTKLPVLDEELSELHVLGLTDAQIAARYGVSRQAVSLRFSHMKMNKRRHLDDVNRAIAEAWPDISRNGHHSRFPIQSLRVWVRARRGDDLSARQAKDALNFEKRIRSDGVVLAYEAATEAGFRFVPREPTDGQLVVRWPADCPPPSAEAIEMFTLPGEEGSATNP